MMGFRPDPPSVDIGSHHVGAPQSPHAAYPADDLPLKLTKLIAKLGLQWCAQCGDFHEIAGGSSATRTNGFAGVGNATPPMLADGS